jgi:peptide/nickel transport system substrate-binding protein
MSVMEGVMMRCGFRGWRRVAAVLFMMVLVVGVSSAWAKEKPAELVLAVGGESAEGYDPLMGWGMYGHPLFQSTLLRRDANLKIVGELATSWELAEDRLTWRVEIRKDAVFSDGEPLTAEDVAFTFNKAAEASGKTDVTALKEAVATGPYALELRLREPQITFVNNLITLGIVPKHAYGPGYARNPVGSGPYVMVNWAEGQQLIVAANPHYYGTPPAFERVVFLFTDEDTSFAAAKAGKVHMVGVPSSLAKQAIPGMKLHVVESVDNRGLMFPMNPDVGEKTPSGYAIGNTVTADKAIRKAVNYAIDRELLVEGVLEGFGSPAYGVADNLPWDQPSIRFKDNDPAKARAILAAGGWTPGADGIMVKDGQRAEFDIIYNAKDSLRQALALAVSGMLRPVGIDARAKGANWDEIKKNLTYANVVVYGFGDHSPLEMYKLYHSRPDLNIYNAGRYANPVVDDYLDTAMGAPSFEASIPSWQAAQWDGTTGFAVPGDAAWAWLVNLNHTYFVDQGLDVGVSQMEPHGHGWPITANIEQWKWIGE